MPAGFDPHLYFGEEDGEDEDGKDIDCKQSRIEGANENDIHSKVSCSKNEKVTEQVSTNTSYKNEKNTEKSSARHKPKLNMSWKEKQKLLFKIYDEGKIPAELID